MEGALPNFVEEIDFSELQFLEIVGRGAFGVVSRAKWRGQDVAVKLIETESEKKAFITELKQLSRVCHPNIVTLYGACTNQPVCLVMEYAEGGSLYNVLHGAGPQARYSSGHAMSWALQCARGVEYLHNMKPKALIHRDLKPPNLLLISGGTVLKICDFGTACDAHTHMTNNKGSAAWMAPEVFEGSNYSEKCDVFSWGIILWEVITRRKPFDEIGGPAFRIMWAVHSGTRPPVVKNCPKPIAILMTRCWSSNPVERPAMCEVVRIMTHLFQFFEGADEPLVYPIGDQDSLRHTVDYDTNSSAAAGAETRSSCSTMQDTIRQTPGPLVPGGPRVFGERVPKPIPSTPSQKPVVFEDRSAPASLQASRENLIDQRGTAPRPGAVSNDVFNKRYSADLSSLQQAELMLQAVKISDGGQCETPVRGHRRTGSHGTPFIPSATRSVEPATFVPGHRRSGSFDNVPNVQFTTGPSGSPSTASVYSMHSSATAPGSLDQAPNPSQIAAAIRSYSWTPGLPMAFQGPRQDDIGDGRNSMFNDPKLQPLPPCPTCPESMEIYRQHCTLVEEYIRVQAEIVQFELRRKQLVDELQRDEKEQTNILKNEYANLWTENEELKLLHGNLKKQVEQIREQQQEPRQP